MASDSSLSAQVDKLNINDQSNSAETAPSELVASVDELLNQLSSKFSTMSSELISKMDEMSRRLDSLEATIQSQGDDDGEK